MSLKHKTFTNALWTFIDIFVNKGIYFFATILLARIIGPSEFGIFGILLLFISIGNNLIDSGLSASLFRTNSLSESDYSTVYIATFIFSIIVYLIFFFTAPIISNFYDKLILIDVIRIYCLGIVVNSLRSIFIVKLTKEFEFKKLTLLNLPGNIISFLSSIALGYLDFGIWSLVNLFLVNQIITTILFWLFIPWKPHFYFDPQKFKYHFVFGYKLLIASQLNTVFENLYNLIIPKFYDLQTLAIFERAYSFNNYPASLFSGIVSKISLPSLALIKDNPDRIHHFYKNILQISFLISSSCFLYFFLIASDLIEIILGSQWLEVVPFFRILSLSFIFYPIHSININVLNIYGRSDLFLKVELIKKIVSVTFIVLSFNFGIYGLLWSSVFVSIISLFINTLYSSKYIKYTLRKQFIDLLPVIFCIIVTGVMINYFSKFFLSTNSIYRLLQFTLTWFLFQIFIFEIVRLKPYIKLKIFILDKFNL